MGTCRYNLFGTAGERTPIGGGRIVDYYALQLMDELIYNSAGGQHEVCSLQSDD
jgi:hypothetical protein